MFKNLFVCNPDNAYFEGSVCTGQRNVSKQVSVVDLDDLTIEEVQPGLLAKVEPNLLSTVPRMDRAQGNMLMRIPNFMEFFGPGNVHYAKVKTSSGAGHVVRIGCDRVSIDDHKCMLTIDKSLRTVICIDRGSRKQDLTYEGYATVFRLCFVYRLGDSLVMCYQLKVLPQNGEECVYSISASYDLDSQGYVGCHVYGNGNGVTHLNDHQELVQLQEEVHRRSLTRG